MSFALLLVPHPGFELGTAWSGVTCGSGAQSPRSTGGGAALAPGPLGANRAWNRVRCPRTCLPSPLPGERVGALLRQERTSSGVDEASRVDEGRGSLPWTTILPSGDWELLRGVAGLGGGGGQRVEEQGTWASQKHSEAGYGRPVDRGVRTAKTVKRPRQQPAHPQYANYWAPLTRKRHIMPHSAQPQHNNYWAPRTRKRKRHQQEHRPQRPSERSDPTQHAKGRTGDCPGPRKGAATRRNVTQGGGGVLEPPGPPGQ